MYSAFPEFIRAEKRLEKLEAELKARENEAESDIYRSLTNEYTELYNKFVVEGGLEFRGRAASILKKMGFDESSFALPSLNCECHDFKKNDTMSFT